MSVAELSAWQQANQRYLIETIDRLRRRLRARVAAAGADDRLATGSDERLDAPAWSLERPAAIEALRAGFQLSAFECDLLVLCAGVELDSGLATFCASLQHGDARSSVTFGLALALLDDAHWGALGPTSALRRWHLVRISGDEGLTQSEIRIDERILHYLVGVEAGDARVAAIAGEIAGDAPLLVSHLEAAHRLAHVWRNSAQAGVLPIVRLTGVDSTGGLAITAAACAALALRLRRAHAHDLPQSAAERAFLARLCEREAALARCAFFIDATQVHPGSPEERGAALFAAETDAPVVLVGGSGAANVRRVVLHIDVDRATPDERARVWTDALGPVAPRLNGAVDRLAAHFDLPGEAIRAIAAACDADADAEGIELALWDGCRRQLRQPLEELAERIEPAAAWSDLVLPPSQLLLLKEVAIHVRRRWRVFGEWGFGTTTSRAQGTCAVFAGPSGTGKTMAAEVLAGDLRLDLYRIDLARTVSKYIGETEKNLARIFDAGERAGAILLFDEADALFGKRSDVKDAHDRYANIEVSYLLQRMEAYRGGLAILTTNMKSALDPSFWRRLRFVVQFPFPDAAQRAEIWRHVFPAGAPLGALDVHKLARLNVSGGNIRSIALNAAFRAAEEASTIDMRHLLWAARSELAKLDRQPADAEIRDWV